MKSKLTEMALTSLWSGLQQILMEDSVILSFAEKHPIIFQTYNLSPLISNMYLLSTYLSFN